MITEPSARDNKNRTSYSNALAVSVSISPYSHNCLTLYEGGYHVGVVLSKVGSREPSCSCRQGIKPLSILILIIASRCVVCSAPLSGGALASVYVACGGYGAGG